MAMFRCGGKPMPESMTYTGTLQMQAANGYGSVTGKTITDVHYPTLGYKKATITASGEVTNTSFIVYGDNSGNMVVLPTSVSSKEFDISNDTDIRIRANGSSTQNASGAVGNLYARMNYTIVLHN